jgi:hypothetical protein
LEEKATIGTKPYAELKYREVKGRRMAYIDEGESIPIEAGPGLQTYAGALVRRGEAVAYEYIAVLEV